MKRNKVFGIGFHKTGTTSLAEALKILGYSVTGPNDVHEDNIADYIEDMVFDLADKYDAFQDNPWPLFYKALDERYPGSKFILTIRPTDSWIDSLVKHFGTKSTPMRKWIYGNNYGCPEGNETIYIDRYIKHNKEIQEYFENRTEDLLIFKLTEGDGWQKLCGFLGEPIPETSFPHANRREDRDAVSGRKHNIINRLIRTAFRKLKA